jgi:hypothetical protein
MIEGKRPSALPFIEADNIAMPESGSKPVSGCSLFF